MEMLYNCFRTIRPCRRPAGCLAATQSLHRPASFAFRLYRVIGTGPTGRSLVGPNQTAQDGKRAAPGSYYSQSAKKVDLWLETLDFRGQALPSPERTSLS